MRVLLIALILSIFLIDRGTAQNLNQRDRIHLNNADKLPNPVIYLSEKDIEGSPYLNPQFISGTVLKKNNVKFNDIPLRFNIYSGSVEFIQDGKILNIADPENVIEVGIGIDKFIYSTFSVARKIDRSFFLLLCEGKYRLLKRYRMRIKGMDSENVPILQSATPQFVRLPDEYYLLYRNGTAQQITNRKKLIKLLQPAPDKINEFIASDKFDFSDEKQLIQLVESVNTIM
ncbi:MAG: hypothetical protein JNK09_19840 [Prolixibacteraceae bacterium]|nr:hypothetical protein [Prolixibacteraceae bacterium]